MIIATVHIANSLQKALDGPSGFLPSSIPRTGHPVSLPLAALAGGSLIFIGVVVAILFAVVFGFYTYRGSAINAHPSDGADGAPGLGEPQRGVGQGTHQRR